jgi:hypothetical protein
VLRRPTKNIPSTAVEVVVQAGMSYGKFVPANRGGVCPGLKALSELP